MNLIEISNKFPTELDAVEYFELMRWGSKAKCAYCGSENVGKRNKDMRFHCKSCNKSFSVTTNTYLHNTRLNTKVWLYAFAIISDAKKGVSAMQIHRNLGISYKTSWRMCHTIRELMDEPIEKLNHIVEMDAAYVGGKPRKGAYIKNRDDLWLPQKQKIERLMEDQKEERKDIREQMSKTKNKFDYEVDAYKKPLPDEVPKAGKGTKKIPIVGIVQRNGNVIAEVMMNITKKELFKLVKDTVDTDKSVLLTDKDPSNKKLGEIIDHIAVNHKLLYSYKGVNTNSIESFWAIIKRGLHGQYHHVSAKYLPKYVQEFVFKYNNRNHDDMFETLVFNSIQTKNK